MADSGKYNPPPGVPPGHPNSSIQQPAPAYSDPRGESQGYYGSPPPQQYGSPAPYGQPQDRAPYGQQPYPQQGYPQGQYQQGPYPPQGMQYGPQPGYPPPGGYYQQQQRGGASEGLCAGLLGCCACLACLDCLFLF